MIYQTLCLKIWTKIYIENLINGDAGAYSTLLNDYEQKVFATCIFFIPNKEDAEDVAQKVFL